MRDTKLTPDSELTGQKGINLIEEVVLDMGFLWHPAGPFDAGIDGRVELRDVRTKEPLNRHLGVQSKARTRFTAEDEHGFEFLCDASDIDYWMHSDCPVLLVCSHPATREAWSVCVNDWFADAERRAARRVAFDKHAHRFTADSASELLRLGTRAEPVLHRQAPAPAEELVTNLLPILEHGSQIWSAPSELHEHWQVHERYEQVGGRRASDYLLRDGRLYTLRDPRDSPLRHLCDLSQLESIQAVEWSEAQDPRLVRYWVELLRRTLLQQFKRQLQWHPQRGVFYFPAPDPLAGVSVKGPNGPRQVVKVEHYFDKRKAEQRVKYVRHHAFRPGFQCVDDHWHLEVEPDYLFTFDGHRESHRAAEFTAGIKRLERNLAVIGHLRMWEHMLTRPTSLLDSEPGLLTFGPLQTVEVPVGIDDALWRGADSRHEDVPPGQEELAA